MWGAVGGKLGDPWRSVRLVGVDHRRGCGRGARLDDLAHAAKPTSLATDDRCASTSADGRSEEHTSELQSLAYLVCRLLLEKKKKNELQSPTYLVCRLMLEKHSV